MGCTQLLPMEQRTCALPLFSKLLPLSEHSKVWNAVKTGIIQHGFINRGIMVQAKVLTSGSVFWSGKQGSHVGYNISERQKTQSCTCSHSIVKQRCDCNFPYCFPLMLHVIYSKFEDKIIVNFTIIDT